jgi:hypothetical protein
MRFQLFMTEEAQREIEELAQSDPDRADKVRRTIGKMQISLRSKGLSTHEYVSKAGPSGEKLFEAYVENNTSNAHRVIWYYGPEQGVITVINVIPHPKDKAKN